jgi:sulfocyanin
MRGMVLAAGVVAGLVAAGCGSQSATYTAPSFPPGNVVQGASLFKTTCTICHGATGAGVPGVYPPIIGTDSNVRLKALNPTQNQLAEFIRDYMPKTNPGSLTKQQASDLAAFLWNANGRNGSAAEQQALALLPKAPTTTTTGPTSASQFLSYQASTKTVTLKLVAGYNSSLSGFNFNGDGNGKMVVTVPVGWKVTVDLTNKGLLPHSAAIVTDTANSTTLAFAGAEIANVTTGIAPGATATFTFTPNKAGTYRIACLVPGHEALGMWDTLKVVSSGNPAISL